MDTDYICNIWITYKLHTSYILWHSDYIQTTYITYELHTDYRSTYELHTMTYRLHMELEYIRTWTTFVTYAMMGYIRTIYVTYACHGKVATQGIRTPFSSADLKEHAVHAAINMLCWPSLHLPVWLAVCKQTMQCTLVRKVCDLPLSPAWLFPAMMLQRRSTGGR